MFEDEKLYTVGYVRYIDGEEHKRQVWAKSEGDAIRKLQHALWKFQYDEFWIVEDEDD